MTAEWCGTEPEVIQAINTGTRQAFLWSVYDKLRWNHTHWRTQNTHQKHELLCQYSVNIHFFKYLNVYKIKWVLQHNIRQKCEDIWLSQAPILQTMCINGIGPLTDTLLGGFPQDFECVCENFYPVSQKKIHEVGSWRWMSEPGSQSALQFLLKRCSLGAEVSAVLLHTKLT